MNKQRRYFDLQVNGYFGVDFLRDDMTCDELHTACEAMQRDGVAGCLATITTAPIDNMCRRLRNIAEYRQRDPLAKKLITGIHIEGPFLNPADGYRGAHDKNSIRPPDLDSVKRLLDAAGGLTRLVTLAPECDRGYEATKMLAKQGIRVSAGHCNPTCDQLSGAIDAGLSMYTHLGNGCAISIPRHDNIIQRALAMSDRLWLMFIADGVHVPFFALRNYLRAAGLQRTIVVTDCVAPAGKGPGRYTLFNNTVDIGEDLAIWMPDRSCLMGSALIMRRAFDNLIEKVGLTHDQAVQLTLVNPQKAMGLTVS